MEIFKKLLETLQKLEGISIISSADDYRWIHFHSSNKNSYNIIYSQIKDIKEQYTCGLTALVENNFKLTLDDLNLESLLIVLDKKINSVIDFKGNIDKSHQQEMGLPDLSLATIKQMAKELKNRHNLIFALVWIENNDKENISIEGSGNPTQLIGLLTRGTHMTIEWADKDIKFHRPKDE